MIQQSGAEMEAALPNAAFANAVHLAAAIARPLHYLRPDAMQLGPFAPAEVVALLGQPAFKRFVEGALLREARIRDLDLKPADIATLSSDGGGRLTMLLLRETHAQLETAALVSASAALQRQVLQLTHKIDRHRMRDILGAANHSMATQEAPNLHPTLAVLGSDRVLSDAMADTASLDVGRRIVVDYGLRLLQAYVRTVRPAFSALMEARLPASAGAMTVPPEASASLADLRKLLRRRMPAWSAIIG
ncbi:MAG: hypothetical protein H7Y08_08115 [Rhizobiaceae bacterium]|nr:hypothetical protein [Rhizobiaceae bacterium]